MRQKVSVSSSTSLAAWSRCAVAVRWPPASMRDHYLYLLLQCYLGGIYYYTTYGNPQITAVDMHRTDLQGAPSPIILCSHWKSNSKTESRQPAHCPIRAMYRLSLSSSFFYHNGQAVSHTAQQFIADASCLLRITRQKSGCLSCY